MSGIMVQWAIWNARNAAVKNNVVNSATYTANQALTLFKEFKIAQDRGNRPRRQQDQNWRAPPKGMVKINFDGAVCMRSNTGGIGIVIRDHLGVILEALQSSVKGTVDPITIETLAVTKGLSLTKNLGFTNIKARRGCDGVRREANSVAHAMAKRALRIQDDHIWLDTFPSDFITICLVDYNHSS
ncbi:hypothetical protein PTKIN_Ptkin11bG0130700 [Pterospermum kingtungense]